MDRRVIITKEQIELLNKVYFHIIMLDSSFEQKTNQVKLKFDIDKIKLNEQLEALKEELIAKNTILPENTVENKKITKR